MNKSVFVNFLTGKFDRKFCCVFWNSVYNLLLLLRRLLQFQGGKRFFSLFAAHKLVVRFDAISLPKDAIKN